MKTSHRIIVVVAMAIVMVSVLPCTAARKKQNDENSIWTERGPGWGPGPGRGSGHRPRGFELTDEEIGRVMKSLKKSDPEKAKQLEKLRTEDPNRFQFELGMCGGEEFGRIVRKRTEKWWQQKHEEFLQWLQKNYQEVTKELEGLKEKDAKVYWDKFKIISGKYWPIFDAEKRNPELAEVLKEDIELKKTRDELLEKIKSTESGEEKKELTGQLEQVIGRRYDLILRRRQIEYEQLLKRVEELQKRLEENKTEIEDWRNERTKQENVKNRVNELLGGGLFKWD
jgi:hypothetical protein